MHFTLLLIRLVTLKHLGLFSNEANSRLIHGPSKVTENLILVQNCQRGGDIKIEEDLVIVLLKFNEPILVHSLLEDELQV